MSGIYVAGLGAVSPAGWGVPALCRAVAGEPIQFAPVERPGWKEPLRARRAPPLVPRPACLTHPRMRRASPISQFAVAAADEALNGTNGPLGIVFCTTCGCVNYSRRFFDEALRDASTASPLLFPETVFNAPASHLSAVLKSPVINYTLVGDSGIFLHGLALAAGWLEEERVSACVVVAAEEADWLTADALKHFNRSTPLAEGAAAVLLRAGQPAADVVTLDAVTSPRSFTSAKSRRVAAQGVATELAQHDSKQLLCTSMAGNPRIDGAESAAWRDWPGARMEVKRTFGEGFAAGAGWQCVAAIEAARRGNYAAAVVSVVGAYDEAIGARFALKPSAPST